MAKWLVDERSGCIAVYYAEKFQKCLSDIQWQSNCKLFEMGNDHNTFYGYNSVSSEQTERANKLADELNASGFIPEIEEDENDY